MSRLASGRLFAASCLVDCGRKSPSKNITWAQGPGGPWVKIITKRIRLIYLHKTFPLKYLSLETQAVFCLWCLCLFSFLNPLLSLLLIVFVSPRHTLPASQWEEADGRSPEWYRETLGDGSPVIIYLHGNLGTRWVESRGLEVEGPSADPNGV